MQSLLNPGRSHILTIAVSNVCSDILTIVQQQKLCVWVTIHCSPHAGGDKWEWYISESTGPDVGAVVTGEIPRGWIKAQRLKRVSVSQCKWNGRRIAGVRRGVTWPTTLPLCSSHSEEAGGTQGTEEWTGRNEKGQGVREGWQVINAEI